MLPILCVKDVAGLRRLSGSFHWPNLRIVLPCALVGIALGTLCSGLLNRGRLLLLAGSIGVGFPLLNWSVACAPAACRRHFGCERRFLVRDVRVLDLPQWRRALLVYLMPQRLERKLFVGTTVMFFMVVNHVTLVPYYFLGQLQPRNLSAALVLPPLAPIGIYAGLWLHRHVTDATV